MILESEKGEYGRQVDELRLKVTTRLEASNILDGVG